MILGQPWPYWLLFLVAGLLLVGVPVCALLERRAEQRDRALWERMWTR